MSENGIRINGAFGKFLAAVVIALLCAGVVGIWQMNGTLNKLVVAVEFIKIEQVRMAEEVRGNSDRIGRFEPYPRKF